MNKGILTVGIIFLALIALLLLQVLNNYSTGSEMDYYLVKETADAAMIDSMDPDFETSCGLPRIDKEKFIENFIYRFANSVDATRSYKIGFYDIVEVPPKVHIKIDSLTTLSFNSTNNDDGTRKKEAADITTNYDVLLETSNETDVATHYNLTMLDKPECSKYVNNNIKFGSS